MIVKLPCQCTGREIVEAFMTASTFYDKNDVHRERRQLRPHKFIDEFECELGSTLPLAKSEGVEVCLYTTRKKWYLFGDKIWVIDESLKFTLIPVVLLQNYTEIEIKVKFLIPVLLIYGITVVTNPNQPEFKYIRPQFEKIINNIYAILESKHA